MIIGHMNWRRHLRQALISGLAYSLGLMAGNLLGLLLATIITVPRTPSEFNTLLIGLVVAFLIAALVGGTGGFAGGFTLPEAGKVQGRWRYAWPSALSMALTYGGFLYGVLLIIALINFYSVIASTPQEFALLFMWAGAFFGALNGLLLGLMTVGWRRALYVMLGGLAGFGLGGLFLGLGGRAYLLSVSAGDQFKGEAQFLLLGISLFGLFGGAALGFVYSYLTTKTPVLSGGASLRRAVVLVVAAGILLFVSWRYTGPLFGQLNMVFTPRDAGLSPTLTSDVVGTHWFDAAPAAMVEGAAGQPALAAGGSRLALAWVERADGSAAVVAQMGAWDEHRDRIVWDEPQTIHEGNGNFVGPQIALSPGGEKAHVAWRDGSQVYYRRCEGGRCDAVTSLPDMPDPACPATTIVVREEAPAIAISTDDVMLIVYHGADGSLRYASAQNDDASTAVQTGCISSASAAAASQLQLAAAADRFNLVLSAGSGSDEIAALEFDGEDWSDSARVLGPGHSPDIVIDERGRAHIAWCDAAGGIRYQIDNEESEQVSVLPCLSRPGIVSTDSGQVHITWFSDAVLSTTSELSSMPVIYESVRLAENWSEPVIVTRPQGAVQPVLAGDVGVLHLAWTDERAQQSGIAAASQVQYECTGAPEGRLAQIAYNVARQTKFQPAGDPIPYCENRYDRLLYTPQPPPSSSLPPTLNGGFDGLAELIRGAEYEVLLSTMDYDEDENDDSPGSVIASAVADLYRQLAANPDRYPRGLTVRILLGNSPPLETLELNSHLWHVLSDLRDAGVPEMTNPELGWRLEVANYEGAWPHSHAKILVVDGKTVVAAGFNMQYLHLAMDHPSRQGKGTVDLALQVTGPVSQDGRIAFDELWTGSVQRSCSELFPRLRPWQLTCRDSKAQSDHVPEVMRYYLPGSEGTTFSMLRTASHNQADEQVVAMLAAADKRIDIMHVQFTLPMICNLNYVLNVCDARHALPFVHSILDAVEKNDARLRLLVDLKPMKGIENAITLAILREEVLARGLEDRIEVRAFAPSVHAKGTLIDDEFLVIGSQNYHWSAFGNNSGLAEYSLGTSDSEAVAEFQRFFNYYWDSTPPEEE